MKAIYPAIIFILLCNLVRAQQFELSHTVLLPDSITAAKAEWADIDNDGLPDIVAFAKTKDHRAYLIIVKGDTVNVPAIVATIPVADFDTYTLYDFNQDNSLDVLISGEKNGVKAIYSYSNEGTFLFKEASMNVLSFTHSRFADFNSDGRHEWLISSIENGDASLKIYGRENDSTWNEMIGAFPIEVNYLEVFDADQNGGADIFVSGRASADSTFTGFLICDGNLKFTSVDAKSWTGTGTISDSAPNGIYEVLFSGVDSLGNYLMREYRNANGSYTIEDRGEDFLLGTRPFAADLNSDGSVDYSYFGINTVGDSINVLQFDGVTGYKNLNHKDVADQHFGDFDHDGDLDLLQLVITDKIELAVLKNEEASINQWPSSPGRGVAFKVFDRVFLYWDQGSDDGTATVSITYDVMLHNSSGPVISSEFDLLNRQRLSPSRGNNGMNNFMLLKNISADNLEFSVQTIDNAFHSGVTVCQGSAGSGTGSSCTNAQSTKLISKCIGAPVDISVPSEVMWFTFLSGYMGKSKEYHQDSVRPDTVFYVDPGESGCMNLHAFVIKVKQDTILTELFSENICAGESIKLGVESQWESVVWRSDVRGMLGTADSIQYDNVAQQDTITAALIIGSCTTIRKTSLNILPTSVTVAEDHYVIMRGDNVQLSAQGAVTYLWTPSENLSNAYVADPVASPSVTTEYKVTGVNAEGCSDEASVIIQVETTGFVPTLFTPNDDGKNDRLRVLGLDDVRDLSFSIFNREGKLMYKASSVPQATNGWDGSADGARQPGGIYFWKVNGRLFSGKKLLLNGKESGSIVLVR